MISVFYAFNFLSWESKTIRFAIFMSWFPIFWRGYWRQASSFLRIWWGKEGGSQRSFNEGNSREEEHLKTSDLRIRVFEVMLNVITDQILDAIWWVPQTASNYRDNCRLLSISVAKNFIFSISSENLFRTFLCAAKVYSNLIKSPKRI